MSRFVSNTFNPAACLRQPLQGRKPRIRGWWTRRHKSRRCALYLIHVHVQNAAFVLPYPVRRGFIKHPSPTRAVGMFDSFITDTCVACLLHHLWLYCSGRQARYGHLGLSRPWSGFNTQLKEYHIVTWQQLQTPPRFVDQSQGLLGLGSASADISRQS